MARPKKNIDSEMVERLAEIHCTYEEMAKVLGCSTDTLKRRYADIIEKKREEAKSSLRRSQWVSALSGNVTMQIWLGKQYLDQHDRNRTELSAPGGGPIQYDLRIDDPREFIASRLARLRADLSAESVLEKPDGSGGNGTQH